MSNTSSEAAVHVALNEIHRRPVTCQQIIDGLAERGFAILPLPQVGEEAVERAAMVWADKADPCPVDQEHIGLRQLDSLCMAARAYAASVEQEVGG